jgi:hypothetical protein
MKLMMIAVLALAVNMADVIYGLQVLSGMRPDSVESAENVFTQSIALTPYALTPLSLTVPEGKVAVIRNITMASYMPTSLEYFSLEVWAQSLQLRYSYSMVITSHQTEIYIPSGKIIYLGLNEWATGSYSGTYVFTIVGELIND